MSLDGSSSTRLIFVWSSCGEVVLIRALSAEPTQTQVSPSRRVNASIGNNFQILYSGGVYVIRMHKRANVHTTAVRETAQNVKNKAVKND